MPTKSKSRKKATNRKLRSENHLKPLMDYLLEHDHHSGESIKIHCIEPSLRYYRVNFWMVDPECIFGLTQYVARSKVYRYTNSNGKSNIKELKI